MLILYTKDGTKGSNAILYGGGDEVYVRPLPSRKLVSFTRVTLHELGETRHEYFKPWFRAHFHALRLIFSGDDVIYVDPESNFRL